MSSNKNTRVKNMAKAAKVDVQAGQVGRKVGQKSVDVETFIKTLVNVHRKGGTQTMVAETLGITPAAVSLRIKYLRDAGVKGLPEFDNRGGNTAGKVVERAKAALKAMGIKG
jgi:hypothetical protein